MGGARIGARALLDLLLIWFGSGGGSHLEISVIPMLGDSLYIREYRLGARAWQGFVANLSM